MSRRPRKLALVRAAEGLPAADDPELPAPLGAALAGARTWPRVAATASTRTLHCGVTDVGRRRAHNEDAFLADERLGLFVVCDGVGGRPFGELAAGAAVSAIWRWIRGEAATIGAARARPGSFTAPALGWLASDAVARVGSLVRAAMRDASRTIHAMAAADPRCSGMCTTASVVLVAGEIAVVGQVGDSRVYHARGASVRQVTEDHTLQTLLGPSRAGGRRSPIVRALGLQREVEVDLVTVPLTGRDRLLLCSDGLHASFERDSILRHLFQLDLRAAASAAVRHANRRGGRDNITALFVEIVGPG